MKCVHGPYNATLGSGPAAEKQAAEKQAAQLAAVKHRPYPDSGGAPRGVAYGEWRRVSGGVCVAAPAGARGLVPWLVRDSRVSLGRA